MEARDFCVIEETARGKVLRYRGWVEPYEGECDMEEPWSIVELDCPVSLKEIASLPRDRAIRKCHLIGLAFLSGQRLTVTSAECAKRHVGREWAKASHLPLESLAVDVPCGDYWF